MNHFLLPFGQETGGDRPVRYGLFAMEVLINELLKNGCVKSRMEAKLFGGAKITAALRDIGGQNALFAKSYLADEGIPCKSESLGGTNARRIVFRPTSGHVRQLIVAASSIELPVSQTVQSKQSQSVSNVELF